MKQTRLSTSLSTSDVFSRTAVVCFTVQMAEAEQNKMFVQFLNFQRSGTIGGVKIL